LSVANPHLDVVELGQWNRRYELVTAAGGQSLGCKKIPTRMTTGENRGRDRCLTFLQPKSRAATTLTDRFR
jgi:hypothetical protein